MTDERKIDPWILRLRAVGGTGLLTWEAAFDPNQRWFLYVISLWLLGAPLEEVVRLFTAGRIAITVRKNDDDKGQP
jgi:hypothetical protein